MPPNLPVRRSCTPSLPTRERRWRSLAPRRHSCRERTLAVRRARPGHAGSGPPASLPPYVTEIRVPPSGDVTTNGTHARQNPSPDPRPDHDRIELEEG
jgi:hypothetical protein